jgi:hypothetical protein
MIRIKPGPGVTEQELRDTIDGWTSSGTPGRNLQVSFTAGTGTGTITYVPSFEFNTPVTQMKWTPQDIFNPVPTAATITSIVVPVK